MKYTSAEAAKLLRKLNEEREALLEKERKSSVFMAAMGEDVESVRPAYEYCDVQGIIDGLDTQIRTVKHAINLFNVKQIVPGFDMTIDQMLIYIPQLTAKKRKHTVTETSRNEHAPSQPFLLVLTAGDENSVSVECAVWPG